MQPRASGDADSSRREHERECYLFGEFELDLTALELRQDGRALIAPRKSLYVLAHLVRHRDRFVSRSELIAAVWPDVRIATGSLTQAIWEIRRMLGARPKSSAIIRTLRGSGYRFVAPVRARPDRSHAPPTGTGWSEQATNSVVGRVDWRALNARELAVSGELQSEGRWSPPLDPQIRTDRVETALVDALTRASAAAEWDVVASLARELQALRCIGRPSP